MTDEEIIFDFFTVEEMKGRQGTPSADPDMPDLPLPTFTPLPKTAGDRVRTTEVVADREEYIRWYESEIGPWTHSHLS